MCRAFLINKAERYDVRGKRILIGKYKYYLIDLGLGHIRNVSKKEQFGAYNKISVNYPKYVFSDKFDFS